MIYLEDGGPRMLAFEEVPGCCDTLLGSRKLGFHLQGSMVTNGNMEPRPPGLAKDCTVRQPL